MTTEQKIALAGIVTIDKTVVHGIPCFAHTRVPVQTLIDFLETGESIETFWPSIRRSDGRTFSRSLN